jgi:hypothetical protein
MNQITRDDVNRIASNLLDSPHLNSQQKEGVRCLWDASLERDTNSMNVDRVIALANALFADPITNANFRTGVSCFLRKILADTNTFHGFTVNADDATREHYPLMREMLPIAPYNPIPTADRLILHSRGFQIIQESAR